MKKILALSSLLLLIPTLVLAFAPATLFKGNDRVAVFNKEQAQTLFGKGYRLETKQQLIGVAAATGTVNIKWVQSQPYTLAGSGAIIGATTITLKSFKNIDETLLTMSNFGSQGFGTLEPGSTANEEQITFTGVTQNANGSATLTGVKRVLNIYPYTETSGLATTHSGGTKFVLSNTAGFYNTFANKENNEVINGVYTFTYNPITTTSTPTQSNQLVTKAYADLLVGTSTFWLPTGNNIYNANSGSVGVGNTGPLTKFQVGNASAISGGSSISQLYLGEYYSTSASGAPQIIGNWNSSGVWGMGAKSGANNNTVQIGVASDVNQEWSSQSQANVSLQVGSTTIGATNVFGNPISFSTASSASSTFNLGFTHIQVITASTTWSKPSGVNKIKIRMTGGGGGGGCNAANNNAFSGGGSAGYVEKIIDVSATTSISITIGVGGGSAQNGSASVFGTWATTTGGAFGTSTAGGAAGTATGGDININGGQGNSKISSAATGVEFGIGGGGANTPIGIGGGSCQGAWNSASCSGQSGSGYGSGGAGCFYFNGGSGGSGANGVVIIEY